MIDVHHGVKVSDDYRWLEDASNPEVRRWSDAQNAYTRAMLDALPGREQLRARIAKLLGTASPDRFALVERGGRLFALEDHPPKQQPFLVVMKSAEDAANERIVVDPNAIDPSGKTSIDFFVPSLDGKKVAVSLSEGGSESG